MPETALCGNRASLFDLCSEAEILARYRANYGLGDEVGIEHVKRHVAVEGRLTDELLSSDEHNRRARFQNAYSRLYEELPWLTETGTLDGGERWAALMKPGASVYEIGSGAGYLIRFLAEHGFDCVGTDLSGERQNAAKVDTNRRLRWGTTDGVKLSDFVGGETFDYVISNQFVEHLHPDDIRLHFAEANKLLKPGGRYICSTPYAPEGPADLTAIFQLHRPIFMHLHEFTFAEMSAIASDVGFIASHAIFRFPRTHRLIPSRTFMAYLTIIDRIRDAASGIGARPLLRKFRRHLLVPRSVWVAFEAPT